VRQVACFAANGYSEIYRKEDTKMKNKGLFGRILCFTLVCVMLLGLVACGGSKEGAEDSTSVSPKLDSEAMDVLGSMPEVDMGGRELSLLTMVGYGSQFEYEGYTGDALNDNRYERNMSFQEKYNCSIYVHSDDNMVDLLINNTLAGTVEFDMIFPHATNSMVKLLTSNVLTDLAGVDMLSLESEWYNQSQLESYVTNDKLYLLANDASLTGQGFFALVYNRNLYEQYGFKESIADKVKAGTWTMEAMRTLLKDVSGVTNDESNQTYAFAINDNATDRWLYAMGQTILTREKDGTLGVGLTQKGLTKASEAFYNLIFNSGAVLVDASYNDGLADSNMYQTFKNGKAMFLTWDIGSTYGHLHDITFQRGYVPLPKLDENQDDYIVLCGSGFWGIPKLAENIEHSAIWMEYNARWGCVSFKPLFFEKILNGRLADYAEDAEMLELMHSKKFADIGFTLDSEKFAKNMLRDVVMANHSAFGASVWVKSNENKLQALADLANTLGKTSE